MRAPYQHLIKQLVPEKYDPRHIEAFMRVRHSTLDGLSRSEFRKEVKLAMACIDEVGPTEAEKYAKSFGSHQPPTNGATGLR
jgi:hypothetical protein